MNRMNWKKEMPEVPESVHMAVLDALENLEYAESNKGNRKTVKITHGIRRGRRMLAAAIVAVTMLGTTALAAEFIWNNKAVEEWNFPSQDLQQDAIDNQVAILQNASVTNNGIKVTVVQTMQDRNRVYVLLKVEAAEEVIDGNSGFDGAVMHNGDGDIFTIFCNTGCGFIDEVEGKLTKDGYLVIDGLKHYDAPWNGDSLHITLSDFRYYSYENYDGETGSGEKIANHVEGTWELEVELADVSSLCKTIPVNMTSERFGVPVTIQDVKLSPLSMEINYRYNNDAIKDLSEEEQANFSKMLLQIALYDKEGKIIEEGVGAVTGGFTNKEAGETNIIAGLNGVIDVDTVDKIIFGNEWLTVPVE